MLPPPNSKALCPHISAVHYRVMFGFLLTVRFRATLQSCSQERNGCKKWFSCVSGSLHAGTMIVRSVSLPRCVRDCFGNLWRPVFSEQGTRTAWCCESSCTYEADDTCINLACSMRYDRQHVVVYVIGVECVKVVSFFSSMQYVRALSYVCVVWHLRFWRKWRT